MVDAVRPRRRFAYADSTKNSGSAGVLFAFRGPEEGAPETFQPANKSDRKRQRSPPATRHGTEDAMGRNPPHPKSPAAFFGVPPPADARHAGSGWLA